MQEKIILSGGMEDLMKQLLFGISMILLGIMCLLISWMGEFRVIDIVGAILGVIGFCFAVYGLVSEG